MAKNSNQITVKKSEKQTSRAKLSDHPIIVIGASAGGFDVIKTIIRNLPANFQPPIFIVWHTGAEIQGVMPGVLSKLNNIPAAYAEDNEEIRLNRIYIAPPDYHLLLQNDSIRLTHGPKENHFRPAIDPLFRSAAYNFGNRVIGVILSGALDDGTVGLWRIKNSGGIAVVQSPGDAEVPSMPQSVIREVAVDYCAPAADIAGILARVSKSRNENQNPIIRDKRTETELLSAAGDKNAARESFAMGELSPLTCPECNGVLAKITEGGFSRYRCHTGHAFSADTLLATLHERVENDLFTALAGIDESIFLLNHIGDHLAEINKSQMAALYFLKAKETEAHADALRITVKNYEQLSNAKLQFDIKNLKDVKNETKC